MSKLMNNSSKEMDERVMGEFTPSRKDLRKHLLRRQDEFTRQCCIRIKIGSWNVAGVRGAEGDLTRWLGIRKNEKIDTLDTICRIIKVERGNSGQDESDKMNVNHVNNAIGWSIKRKQTKVDSHTTSPLDGNEAPMTLTDEKKNAEGKESINCDTGTNLNEDSSIDLYVLCFQEVIDISSPSEALRSHANSLAATNFKRAAEKALGEDYALIAEQQLMGLLQIIYARKGKFMKSIKAVSTASVATGLMGILGNKGGVATRFVIGETTKLAFINCHLAAGSDQSALDRRNWDAEQILSRLKFEKIYGIMGIDDSEDDTTPSCRGIDDYDYIFCAGDLNYRLEGVPSEDVRNLLNLHLSHSPDPIPSRSRSPVSSISSDDDPLSPNAIVSPVTCSYKEDALQMTSEPVLGSPGAGHVKGGGISGLGNGGGGVESLQTTIDCLLLHDELGQQMKKRRAFYDGWREGPIRFFPSYKYDIGSIVNFDSGDTRRCPSWCDRILFRSRASKERSLKAIQEEIKSRKLDEELKLRHDHNGKDSETEEDLIFDYDPERDGIDSKDGILNSNDNATDNDSIGDLFSEINDGLTLESYCQYQGITASDHKPVCATFTLTYNSVDDELRHKIYHELNRSYDRAENEFRPVITLTVDGPIRKGGLSPSNQEPSCTSSVNFEKVEIGRLYKKSITIANTGRVTARISYESGTSTKSPAWLKLTLQDVEWIDSLSFSNNGHRDQSKIKLIELHTGEALTILLTLQISCAQLGEMLNRENISLEDILVIKVDEGRDYFLPVQAEFQQTCLCRSMDELIRLPETGIRNIPNVNRLIHSSKPMWSSPWQLIRVLELLESSVESFAQNPPLNIPAHPQWDDDNNPWWPFQSMVKLARIIQNEATCEQSQSLWNLFHILDTDPKGSLPSDIYSRFPPGKALKYSSNALILMLSWMNHGIIGPEVWKKLDAIIHRRSNPSKRSIGFDDLDDERSEFINTLSESPNHAVTFMLVMSSLSRVIDKLANLHTEKYPSASAYKRDLSIQVSSIFSSAMIHTHTPLSEESVETFHRKLTFLQTFLLSGTSSTTT